MKDSVPTSKGGSKIKKMNFFANIFFILITISTYGVAFYQNFKNKEIYDALYMSFSDVKVIEYGSENYSTLDFVETMENGSLSEYTENLDTKTVGVQRLSYQISQNDISKEYSIDVLIEDTKKPVIKFKKNVITIYVGGSYDYKNNISSVTDQVDGALPYKSKKPEVNEKGYYTITSNLNNKKVGTYKVTVNAVDKNENVTTASYDIKVIAKPVVKKKTTKTTTTTSNKVTGSYTGPSSIDTSSAVNTAKSLLGYRYVYGGASPSTGFDCSGLIYYIYKLQGKTLARTTSGMQYNGKAVSESNMMPGDIIVWSTGRSYPTPTHVALYIGGGQMIHATNPRQGVIKSSVNGWKEGVGSNPNKIVTIRRV